jgi:cellulose synthase operon protein YhjQ
VSRYIVVASPKGGVGKTTLVAQLATRLSASATRCLAVDLDPQNALSMQLGSPAKWVGGHQPSPASLAHTVGVVNQELRPEALLEYLKARRASVAYVPFGVHNMHSRKHAEQALTSDPQVLRTYIDALLPPRCEVVLLDTPAGQNGWAEAALSFADLVLVPLLAEPACLATLPSYEAYLQTHAPQAYPKNVLYVVNRWNPAQQLACDAYSVLCDSLDDRVWSRCIFDDEHMREALARNDPNAQDPGSQAGADLEQLARFTRDWLTSSQAVQPQQIMDVSPKARAS